MAYTTINKSTDYFNTKLYTGNGVGGTNITGVGFQPDLVWIKRRSGTENHVWNDAVRGVPNNIYSSGTNSQDSGSLMSAILSDGFTVQTDASVNSNNDTYVSWNWKANGQGSANTAGSINTTYTSVNTTAGFSISKYNGTGSNATIGHGLGVAPNFIIVKRIDGASGWYVYHSSLGATQRLSLNETDATSSDNSAWNDTAPTNALINLGSSSTTNKNGGTMVAYAFANVTGYQKASSYVGNGSSSAPPFIYLGFKPKFIMVKNTSQTDSWFMHDDKRDGYNDDNEYLRANENSAEGSGINRIRLLSNGFQVPTTDKSHNVSGNTYVYYAVGQTLVGGTGAGVPCTAR